MERLTNQWQDCQVPKRSRELTFVRTHHLADLRKAQSSTPENLNRPYFMSLPESSNLNNPEVEKLIVGHTEVLRLRTDAEQILKRRDASQRRPGLLRRILRRSEQKNLITTSQNTIAAFLAASRAESTLQGRSSNWGLENAIKDLDKALIFFESSEYTYEWAVCFANKTMAVLSLSEALESRRSESIEQAILGLRSALESLARVDGSSYETAIIRMNLGCVLLKRLKLNRSDNVEEAIKCFLEAADDLRVAKVQENQARRIDRLLLPSDETFEEVVQSPFGVRLCLNLGNAYLRRVHGAKSENIERAITCFNIVTKAYTDGQGRNEKRSKRNHSFEEDYAIADWALAKMNRATAFVERVNGSYEQNVERAIAGYDSARRFYSRSELLKHLPRECIAVEVNRASAYLRRVCGDRSQNIERAITGYEAALKHCYGDRFLFEQAVISMNLSSALHERICGDRSKNLERAILGYRRALSFFTRESDPNIHLDAMRLLAETFSSAKRWEEALDAFQKAKRTADFLIGAGLDPAETERVLEEVQALGPGMALAAARTGQPGEALAHLDAGRARQLALGLRRNAAREALAPDRRAVFDRCLTALQVAQVELAAAMPETRGTAMADVVAARGPFEAILDEGQALAAAGEPSLEARLAALGEAGITLAALVFADEGAILLLAAPGRAVEAVDLPGRTLRTLTDLVRGEDGWLSGYTAIYQQEYTPFRASLDTIGDALGELFVGDLVAALDARGVAPGARLALLPQGALGLLPLGLARDPQSGERLMDRYELAFAPNLAALDARPDPAHPALVSVINPTSNLPFTPVEGALVAALFGPDVSQVEGTAATRASVLAALDGRSHWHFACHGAFDWQDARSSGLKLSNGEALTLGDLLQAGTLKPPRLVVLSACETGLTEINRNPEEFIGLPAGFLERGAGAVLSTLWPVSDASTALLIQRFFELHIGEGRRPTAALKAAQAWLRELSAEDLVSLATMLEDTLLTAEAEQVRRIGASPGPASPKPRPFEHPYYWAGFAIHGT